MGFRDDRDAAFERVDALEKELARKQQELDGLRDTRRAARRRVMIPIVAAAGLTLVLGGVTWWAVAAQSRRAAAEQERVEAEQLRAEAEQVRLRARAAADEARAQAEMAQLRVAQARAEAEATARSMPTVDLSWPGEVLSATGATLAPGASCVLGGTFAGADPSTFRALWLRCGSEVLYALDRDGQGAHPTGRLRHGPVLGRDAHEYMLSYTDDGARDASRWTMDVSTLQHHVTVTRGGDAPARVEVYVRDVSLAVEGAAVGAQQSVRAPAFAPALERAARVASVHGAAPARAGARCSVEVRPVWEFNENCRIAVRCGAAWVYGARESGYLTCALRDGQPVGALDDRTTGEGGDPKLEWRGSRIVVSDFTEQGAWDLTLTL